MRAINNDIRKNKGSLLEIGSNIRKWRTLRGIKQESMAEQLDISNVALSKIETGKTDIPLSRLVDIAYILELKIHFLFTDPCELIQKL